MLVDLICFYVGFLYYKLQEGFVKIAYFNSFLMKY